MNDPTVSVLMSVRDGARHLPATIESLRALKPPAGGVEIIAIDDASSDVTPRLLADWAACDHRVRVITAEAPMGLATALNRGLARARAPLVARADADDLYHPQRLVRQAAAMQADPRLAALGCGYVRIEQDGTERDRVVPPQGPDWIGFRMLFSNSLLHPGVMFCAEAVRGAGGYDPAYWTAQDSDLWARLVARGARLDNLPEPLVRYRLHEGSVMRRRGAAGQALSLTVPERLQRAYLGDLPAGHDIAATVGLYQSRQPLEPAAIRAGLAGLARIHAAARGRESTAVLAAFRAEVARALWRQARWTGRRDAPLTAALIARAARWQVRARWGRQAAR